MAVRNILIGDNNTEKLSDFGLARDITDTEVYFRTNQVINPCPIMYKVLLLRNGNFNSVILKKKFV